MSGTKVWWKLVAFGSLTLVSCGKSTNVNQIFTSSGDEDRFDTLMALGRIHYDRGEHNAAEKYAHQAYELNRNSEQAAILYADAVLGQVGIDPFSMTKAMVKLTESKTDTTAATTTPATTKLAESTTNGATALLDFATLISISKTDIAAMGITEESENTFFKDDPIFIPTGPDAEGGPRAVNPTLINIKKAVQILCPFVAAGARVENYELHACTDATGAKTEQAKSHFLWALAHLAEALAFNSALLYDGSAATTTLAAASTPDTGLFRRVAKLEKNTFKVEQVGDYIEAVVELKKNVTDVFNTAPDGMLFATLADLTAVSLAFSEIAGMPASVTKKIKAGLTSIEELGSKLSSSTDSALDKQSQALKLQMTTSVNKSLKATIAKVNTGYGTTAEIKKMTPEQQATVKANKSKLCTTYKDVSGYSAGDTTLGLPDGCT